jgi:hypothetical protein
VDGYAGMWCDFAPFWRVELAVTEQREKDGMGKSGGRLEGEGGRSYFRERVEAVEKRLSDPSLHGVLRFGGRPRRGRVCGLGYRAASLSPSLSHLLAFHALLTGLAARIRLRHARRRLARTSPSTRRRILMGIGRGRLIRCVLRLRCVFRSVDLWFLVASCSLWSCPVPSVLARSVHPARTRTGFAVASLP